VGEFETEFPTRRTHLDALPGKLYFDWAESLNRAAKLFGANTAELRLHLVQFAGQPTCVDKLPR
jgi:hypothetical protein